VIKLHKFEHNSKANPFGLLRMMCHWRNEALVKRLQDKR
jgi:hypothetical protein